MGILDHLDLPNLQERPRCAVQKGQMTSRLDAKLAKDKDADKAWDACKKAVDARDGMKCRVCKVKVVRSMERLPKRAEHHHLVKRREKALLTDQRNVVLVCLADHERLERNKLLPVQTAALMFAFAGRSLVNADQPIEFKKADVARPSPGSQP